MLLHLLGVLQGNLNEVVWWCCWYFTLKHGLYFEGCTLAFPLSYTIVYVHLKLDWIELKYVLFVLGLSLDETNENKWMSNFSLFFLHNLSRFRPSWLLIAEDRGNEKGKQANSLSKIGSDVNLLFSVFSWMLRFWYLNVFT